MCRTSNRLKAVGGRRGALAKGALVLGSLLGAAACTPSALDGKMRSIGVAVDMSETARSMDAVMALADEQDRVMLPLHAALEIKTPEKTFYRDTLTSGQELELELPFGKVQVRGLFLVESRFSNWKDQCEKDDASSTTTRTSSTSSTSASTSSHEESGGGGQDERHDEGGVLYVAAVSRSFDITKDTGELAIPFGTLSEVGQRQLLARALPDSSSAPQFTYSDAVANKPIIDPCTGQPFSDQPRDGLFELFLPRADLPALAETGGRPFSPALLTGSSAPWFAVTSEILALEAEYPSQREAQVNTSDGTGSSEDRLRFSRFVTLDTRASPPTIYSLPAAGDSDGDGFSNGDEFTARTNPFAPQQQLILASKVLDEGWGFEARANFDEALREQSRGARCIARFDLSGVTTDQKRSLDAHRKRILALGNVDRRFVADLNNPFETWCYDSFTLHGIAGRVTVEMQVKDNWGLWIAKGTSTLSIPIRTVGAPPPRVSGGPASGTDSSETVQANIASPPSVNETPSRSDVANQSTDEDTPVTGLAVTLGDGAGPLKCDTALSGGSDNQTLLPDANITFGGSYPACTVSLSPAPDEHGTAMVTLTVSDGSLSVTDTLTFTVNPVNDSPTVAVAGDTFKTTSQDVAVNVALARGGDVDIATDSQRLTYVVSKTPVKGYLGILPVDASLGGNLVYTPNPGHSGSDSFSYQICDNFGTPACTSEITVSLDTMNDTVPPQISSMSQTLTSASLSDPTWDFTWVISDNLIANNLLKVVVRRIDTPTTGPGSADFPGLSTPILTQSLGLTSLSGETGVPDQHRRIAYLFTVEDSQGNQASLTAAVDADLSVPIPPVITSLSEGDFINRFRTRVQGTCDPNASYTTTLSVPTGHVEGQAQKLSCGDGSLSFDLHLGAGSDPNLEVELTTTKPNGNAISKTLHVNYHRPCPTGYVGVAGLTGESNSGDWDDPVLNAGLGNVAARYGNADPFLDPGRDFCVMKYPAKAQTSPSNPEGAFQPIDLGEQRFSEFSHVIPDSRPSGRPWTNISQVESETECGELNAALLGSASPAVGTFSLISNTQWQVMARSIEATGANWSDGAVHNGVLNRGHTDNAMSTTARQDGADLNATVATTGALSHSSDDSKGYFGTGQSTGEQKRTFVLPNGEILWDVGGNVWQWVRDLKSELGLTSGNGAVSLGGWADYGDGTSTNTFSKDVNLVFGSFGKPGTSDRLQYPSETNGGGLYRGGGDALLRGGNWDVGSGAGVFATALYYGPANAYSNIAPRCSFSVAEISGTDSSVPEISNFRRTNSFGTHVANTAVTVASGGTWHVAWDLADTVDANSELYVQVRRKFTSSQTDYPSVSDPVYKEGFGLTKLERESGWTWDESRSSYSPNSGLFATYLVTATDLHGNRSDPQSNGARFSVDHSRSCPSGYVGVAGLNGTSGSGQWDDPVLNAGLGNVAARYGNADPFLDPGRDFCVMKYPAKAQTSPSNPEGAFQPIDLGEQSFSKFSHVIPDSRPSGRPWTNISQDQSETECGELNVALLGSASPAVGTFSLISNTQWQVMARSIEATGANWSKGAVHNGVLNRGHTDDGMSTTARQDGADLNATVATTGALSHSSDDSKGYFGTGQSTGEQKRTFVLPNGEILWDVGGNVWQWVRDLKSELGLSSADDTAVGTGNTWADYGDGTSKNTFSEDVNLVFGSFGKPGTSDRLQYPSGTNGGGLYPGGRDALLRGGDWNKGSNAGVFAANLVNGSTDAYSGIAPRCSFLFSESP